MKRAAKLLYYPSAGKTGAMVACAYFRAFLIKHHKNCERSCCKATLNTENTKLTQLHLLNSVSHYVFALPGMARPDGFKPRLFCVFTFAFVAKVHPNFWNHESCGSSSPWPNLSSAAALWLVHWLGGSQTNEGSFMWIVCSECNGTFFMSLTTQQLNTCWVCQWSSKMVLVNSF